MYDSYDYIYIVYTYDEASILYDTWPGTNYTRPRL